MDQRARLQGLVVCGRAGILTHGTVEEPMERKLPSSNESNRAVFPHSTTMLTGFQTLIFGAVYQVVGSRYEYDGQDH